MALGTPIEVVVLDVYSGNENKTTPTTDFTTVSTAISQARYHHNMQSGAARKPGVICIAIGSNSPAESAMMDNAVTQAVAAGLTVVVSAGNNSSDASLYVPSAYGSKPGVICVGASRTNNERYPTSNYDFPIAQNPVLSVDLFAPGRERPHDPLRQSEDRLLRPDERDQPGHGLDRRRRLGRALQESLAQPGAGGAKPQGHRLRA